MDNVTALVQRLTARYRRRRILRAATGSSLGLSCAGLVAVRLQQAGLDPVRLVLISAALVALIAAWQWRSLRRDRPAFGAIAELDRSLGLHARLLTAVEFADAPEPPALYEQLLKETAAAIPDVQRRLPPVLDRPGAALAVAALLLLLWPQASRLQVAMTPSMMPLGAQPPDSPPEPPQPQDQQSNQQQDQQQQSQQPQAGKSGEQSNESKGGQPPQQASGTGQQPPRQPQPSQSGTQQQQAGAAKSQQPSGSQPQAAQSQAQQAQAGKKDEKGHRQQGGDRGQADSAQLAAKGEKGDPAKAGGNAGALSDAAQQQALKADIQQLLKELSSELKQLQADMDAKQPNAKEPSPLAGGSTDPDLYDKPAALEKASGSRLPVQLEVDTKPTASPRKGSGTNEASKQAADALPQQEPENASLSDVRTTEQGQARHAIPPDYQPVFERLSPAEQPHS